MSSSSEDDFYGNTAQKLHELKKNWNPGIKIDTVDSDCPSDSDKSPIVVDSPSPKIQKNKKLKKRVPAKKISATDSTGSTESDISRACANFNRAHVTADDASAPPDLSTETPPGAAGALPRSRRSRGNTRRTPATRGTRRSRGRHRFSNAQAVVNLGCWTDEEDSSQPLFAKPQAKPDESNDVEFDTSLNCSDKESENEEISVKVHWRSKEYHKFPIRKYQKIKPIFDFFTNLESVPVDHLLLSLGDRVLRPQDTPADFNYNICQFIEGGVVTQSVAHIAEESAKQYGGVKRNNAANSGAKLHIKLQTVDTKVGKPFKIWMGADQKFSYAMMRFSEEYELPLDKLKLYFDGEIVDIESTPRKLDFEGDECIDVKISP